MKGRLTRSALAWAQSRVASPIIVETEAKSLRTLAQDLAPYVQEVLDKFPRIFNPSIEPFIAPLSTIPRFNLLTAYLPREVIFYLAEQREVIKIHPDKMVYAMFNQVPKEGVYRAERPLSRTGEVVFTTTEWTKKLIGADEANKAGYTGKNVIVSINDTGASRTHEQIRRVTFESAMAQYRDENGHGSWCTSCIGGVRGYDEVLSRATKKEIWCEGMAPECDLLAIKCLGFFVGVGSTSGILKSLAMSLEGGADIISMSLGGDSEASKAEDDPYYKAMDEIVKQGSIPVIAAGNSGPNKGTINSPGCLPQVLTVGALDQMTGKMADFSSRGPTEWNTTKPDVIAPGVNINSGIVGVLDTSGDARPSRYSPISGTSMATPHVAGLLACMRQCHRYLLDGELLVEEVKNMMKELGSEKNNNSGWGMISWSIYKRWMDTEYGVKI